MKLSVKSLETNEELPKANISKTNRQKVFGILLPNKQVWVLLETKYTVGYKMAAFRFEGLYLSSFGELKREPKYVKTETS